MIYDDVYMMSGLTPLERLSHDPGVFSSRGRWGGEGVGEGMAPLLRSAGAGRPVRGGGVPGKGRAEAPGRRGGEGGGGAGVEWSE